MEAYLPRFLAAPETILTAEVDLQLAIANYINTPYQLLAVLVNSPDLDVASAARLHVTWAGELEGDTERAIDDLLKTQQIGQNDRLAVELFITLGTVPPCFLSEWVPPEKIVEGLENEYLPAAYKVQLLSRLVREDRSNIVVEVASCVDTPSEILAELIGSMNAAIRIAVRSNPSCPVALIEVIDREYNLAANWETSPERLGTLARSRWEWIRWTVAGNPATNATTLMELAGDELWQIKLAVAKNPHAPAEVLQVLTNSDIDSIRYAVASNSNTSEETLKLLFPFCKRILWNRKDVPLSILERFFADRGSTPIWKDYVTRDCLLRAVNTSPELLDRLAIDCHQEVSEYYEGIRKSCHSQEIVEKWIADATNYLRSIVEHPNICLDTLMRLSTYPNPNVRLAVGLNAKVPEETRITLLRDAIEYCYKKYDTQSIPRIVSNPNVPLSILEELVNRFLGNDLILRQLKSEIPDFSNSLLDRLLEFVTNRDSAEQILLHMQESVENQDRNIAEWEDFLDSLSDVELDCIQKMYGTVAIQLMFMSGFANTPRWAGKGIKIRKGRIIFKFSSAFYLFLVLMYLRQINNDSNRGSLQSGEIVIIDALIENHRLSPAIRNSLWQKYYRAYMEDSRGYYSPTKAEAIFRQKFLIYPAESIAEREDDAREIIKYGYCNKRMAWHPQTPPNILRELMAKNRSCSQEIAQNTNAPRDVLLELSKDNNQLTRRYVAENPNTPVDILSALTNDGALNNPNFPPLERYRSIKQRELDIAETEAAELISNLPLRNHQNLTQILEGDDRNAKLKLLANPKTSTAVLERLSRDADEIVRARIANLRNLPLHIQLILAEDSSPQVRQSLASKQLNRSIPVEILVKLANDPYDMVRKEIASNPNTPSEILAQLADDSSGWVTKALVGNENTPVEVLEYLGVRRHIVNAYNRKTPPAALAAQVDYALTLDQQAKTDIFEYLLRNLEGSQMPASSLDRLANSNESWIRSNVAHHRNTPAATLEQLSNNKSYEPILWGIARNPNSPPALLEKLLRESYETVAGAMVERAIIPPNIMGRLLDSNSEYVRSPIVSRNNFPLDLADRVIRTETHDSVLISLARNPILTSELISEFIQLHALKPDICTALIAQPQLTIEHWQQLATSQFEAVRLAIASRQNTPIDILVILSDDRELKIRMAIASNIQTSSDILIKLATDLEAEVRTKVAANPQTPVPILETLATDASIEVRRSVLNNPQTPASIRQNLEDIFGRKPIATTIDTLRDLPCIYDPVNDDVVTILTEYARSSNAFVRLVSLLHPLMPPEVIERASSSAFWSDRYAVAKNPATPDLVRQNLRLDSNRIVRSIARIVTL